MASQVQSLPQDNDHDGPAPAGEQETMAKPSCYTKKQVRGAGVGGGAVGLVLGGPILAVMGDFRHCQEGRQEQHHKAGQFCLNKGQEVSNA